MSICQKSRCAQSVVSAMAGYFDMTCVFFWNVRQHSIHISGPHPCRNRLIGQTSLSAASQAITQQGWIISVQLHKFEIKTGGATWHQESWLWWTPVGQGHCHMKTLEENIASTCDGLSKCLFPVLLINRNSMRAASCLPSKNITYLNDVKTWKFFVTFGNLSKTTGIG